MTKFIFIFIFNINNIDYLHLYNLRRRLIMEDAKLESERESTANIIKNSSQDEIPQKISKFISNCFCEKIKPEKIGKEVGNFIKNSPKEIVYKVVDDFTDILFSHQAMYNIINAQINTKKALSNDNPQINIEEAGKIVGNIINIRNSSKQEVHNITNNFVNTCFKWQEVCDKKCINLEEVGKGVAGIIKNSPKELAPIIFGSFICTSFEKFQDGNKQTSLEEIKKGINSVIESNPEIRTYPSFLRRIKSQLSHYRGLYKVKNEIITTLKNVISKSNQSSSKNTEAVQGFLSKKVDENIDDEGDLSKLGKRMEDFKKSIYIYDNRNDTIQYDYNLDTRQYDYNLLLEMDANKKAMSEITTITDNSQTPQKIKDTSNNKKCCHGCSIL